jgi:hypothetical protein
MNHWEIDSTTCLYFDLYLQWIKKEHSPMLFLFLYDTCTCNKGILEHQVQLPAADPIHNNWLLLALASLHQREEIQSYTVPGDRSQINAGKRMYLFGKMLAHSQLFKTYLKAAQWIYLLTKHQTTIYSSLQAHYLYFFVEESCRTSGERSQTTRKIKFLHKSSWAVKYKATSRWFQTSTDILGEKARKDHLQLTAS